MFKLRTQSYQKKCIIQSYLDAGSSEKLNNKDRKDEAHQTDWNVLRVIQETCRIVKALKVEVHNFLLWDLHEVF